MTPEEKTKIAELRNNGLGYKMIAEILGLKESAVKLYCHRHGLAVAANKKPEMVFPGVVQKECKTCGKPFLQYPGHREKFFCSAACRIKWWNTHLTQVKRKAMYEYTCPVCRRKFSAYGNRNRKYCSRACYIKARFGGRSCR